MQPQQLSCTTACAPDIASGYEPVSEWTNIMTASSVNDTITQLQMVPMCIATVKKAC